MNIKEKAVKTQKPIKVMQFGEGNFLRAFVDYMIDIANEKGVFDGSIAIVKPISFGSLDMFKEMFLYKKFLSRVTLICLHSLLSVTSFEIGCIEGSYFE